MQKGTKERREKKQKDKTMSGDLFDGVQALLLFISYENQKRDSGKTLKGVAKRREVLLA